MFQSFAGFIFIFYKYDTKKGREQRLAAGNHAFGSALHSCQYENPDIEERGGEIVGEKWEKNLKKSRTNAENMLIYERKSSILIQWWCCMSGRQTKEYFIGKIWRNFGPSRRCRIL